MLSAWLVLLFPLKWHILYESYILWVKSMEIVQMVAYFTGKSESISILHKLCLKC